MAFDWLFGPRVLSRNDSGIGFNAFRLDLSDLEDLVAVCTQLHGPARVFRRAGPAGLYYTTTDYTHEISNLTDASDADLREIQIQAGPVAVLPDGSIPHGQVVITMGASALALVAPGASDELRDRVVRIITENGRRRVQPYRAFLFGTALMAGAFAGLPIWTFISTRSVPVAVVATLASFLAWRGARQAALSRAAARGWDRHRGRATIDNLTRNARRAERWSSHRDWKVAGFTAAVTIAAAVLAGWATGVFA